jgi:hypothetical protein
MEMRRTKRNMWLIITDLVLLPLLDKMPWLSFSLMVTTIVGNVINDYYYYIGFFIYLFTCDFILVRAVSEAIENAQEVVFIEDWWLVKFSKTKPFFCVLN